MTLVNKIKLGKKMPWENKIYAGKLQRPKKMFRKILDRGEAGDNVGILLRGIEKDQTRYLES